MESIEPDQRPGEQRIRVEGKSGIDKGEEKPADGHGPSPAPTVGQMTAQIGRKELEKGQADPCEGDLVGPNAKLLHLEHQKKLGRRAEGGNTDDGDVGPERGGEQAPGELRRRRIEGYGDLLNFSWHDQDGKNGRYAGQQK